MSYDAWLERPYQQAAAQEAAYEEWAESEGLDLDDPESRRLYDEWLYDAAEDAAVDRAEWRYA